MSISYAEQLPVENEAAVEQLEDIGVDAEVEMSVAFDTTVVVREFPVNVVPTRQAGFSVESYVVIDGHPVASPISARTEVTVKGYDLIPNRPPQASLEALLVRSRWIPSLEDYNGVTLSPVAGTAPFSLEADDGDEPALLDQIYGYTVGGEWVSATGLDFTDGEYLSGDVPAVRKAMVAAVIVLRRTPSTHCGVIELADASGTERSNPYLSLRYTSTDELQLLHNNTVLFSTSHTASETDAFVVAMSASQDEGLARIGVAFAGRRFVAERGLVEGVPAIPPNGVVYVGRTGGSLEGYAEMALIDMAWSDEVDEESMHALLAEYASTYLYEPEISEMVEEADADA